MKYVTMYVCMYVCIYVPKSRLLAITKWATNDCRTVSLTHHTA